MSFGTNPVVNTPFAAPRQHYQLGEDGQPTGVLVDGRRPSVQIVPVPQARRQKKEPELDLGDLAQRVEENRLVNRIRERVDAWRKSPDRLSRVTPETRRLIEHWTDPDRTRKLFFCQIEALETLIYLTEVDPGRFRGEIEEANEEANPGLTRLASKMATGSGKTTVMAMIIAWHAVNKARHRNSSRFTDAFLVVCPGITIKDRLRVLMPSDPENVYAALDLVPTDLRDGLGKARIVITNYHAFMPRETLQVSKLNRQVLGGLEGEKRFVETDGQMVRRVAKDLMGRKGILVLNDEAHHCYRHRELTAQEKLDAEEKDEAKRAEEAARVWITGIEAFDRVLGIKTVHDLSATPFNLKGSGYPEGSLFKWVVSDFSLLDAIESGIVKVPRIPVLDDRVAGEMPLFRNLYRNIQAGDRPLPRKGRAKQSKIAMDPQDLPGLLESALGALYGHYAEIHEAWEREPLLGRPPVFIVVCNNTTTSKLVYDHIAGYEIEDPEGGPSRFVPGRLKLFQNIDDNGREARPMRTLLIDSEQLDSGEALSDEFLRAAGPEIARFKEEMRRRGQGDPEKLSPQDILREVMNTVGRPGKLGGDIRCVVSVSMLTEGWDANTVTHILGVRAFGTQLLCEQVVGRGLRRMSYEVDRATGLFPVEYADVLGIPFTFANASKTKTAPKPPPPVTHVRTRRDRPDLEIRFPRVQGYRVVFPRRPLTATFTENSRYELTPDMIPTQVENEPFIGEGITFDLREDAERLRLKSVIFDVAGHTLRKYFRDDEGAVEVWRFPELVRITERWFDTCLVTRGEVPKQFMKFRQFADEAANRIYTACARGQAAGGGTERTLPILDPFTPEGSTNHVDFTTTKTLLFKTRLSPVDHVVADSEWELAFAETLERMKDVVVSYVKNHALQFEIPYHYAGAERRYRPDYVVRLRDGGAKPLNLVVEIKGLKDNKDAAKADVATGIWVPAVNAAGRFGRWAFVEIGQDIFEAERVLRGIAAGKREAA
ncbi:BPTD_3080 family restriction endonuclease [Salinarimonas chemoclinalis]|uniref:BPTD_3080 family restriction endonuclease n=1 Tax=Salinarimonas chemoclinalis TaxID=3241599 RepID=UPI003555F6FE